MKLFDSHCHLNDEKFNDDIEEVINNICKEGIINLVVAGYSVESSKKAIEISKNKEFIYTTVGISPNDIPQSEDELWKELDEIKEIIKTSKKIVAVGEIGLDYYWNKENKDLQKLAFIEQIKIANEFNLPIVIHTRDAYLDTIDILKNNNVVNKGVFHCCPQNLELIKSGLDLGFYISFAGPVTFKNAKNSSEVIKAVPIEKILTETDSPYLAPEPLRGTRNVPSNVKYVLEKIANVKELSIQEVEEIIINNTKKIFKI